MKEKTSIFIPARMMSSRFPGKPLAPIDGIPMVVYCAKNAIETGVEVYVCTDSNEIKTVCELYGVNAILTPECETGTDRIAIAADNLETDYIINLQGDEPLVDVASLNKMISMLPSLAERDTIITGVAAINSEEAFDPNNVKCALIKNSSKIQYFSRKPLLNSIKGKGKPSYYKQVGVYGMPYKTLKKFSLIPKGELEEAERVELLRWLENGLDIFACLIENKTISVDTPNDLVEVISYLKTKNNVNT
ncbi:3-deoxy-manno-octulosonate cytidylyltransferase [Prochlorococcus sp. MIT 1223]|uniref:3-deoxy-manno-octulosonate cytidylyltransferase n=1 Tax=Prochlorococcus sp. MIT 1223 TaxID=3096217 RepID=UPI002A75365C|nr:3-deoxy-manno-octulosonate cytidylyltransferase [Prochlorococcus sp. MIT 1223]